MITAAETRDKDLIQKSQRVLDILYDRKIIDYPYVQQVKTLMESRSKSGRDEDGAISYRFFVLTDKLITAKQNKIEAMSKHESDDVIRELILAEKAARETICEFFTQQLNEQYHKIASLEKSAARDESKNLLLHELDDLDDDDSDKGVL